MFKTKIINLERRQDRWLEVVPEVERFGITEIERFNAFEGGYMGFNKSVHFAIENEGEMLLLEDDVRFINGANLEKLFEAIAVLPADWDLLYLGANLKSPIQVYNEKLYRITDAWTSHAILYSAKGAKYCFDNFNHLDGIIYDEWLRTHAQRHLQCFITYPMMAIQADNWSDIWGANAVYGIEGSSKHFHK